MSSTMKEKETTISPEERARRLSPDYVMPGDELPEGYVPAIPTFATPEDAERWETLQAAMKELGDELRRNGVTLEELIEDGYKIRERLFREKYARLKK